MTPTLFTLSATSVSSSASTARPWRVSDLLGVVTLEKEAAAGELQVLPLTWAPRNVAEASNRPTPPPTPSLVVVPDWLAGDRAVGERRIRTVVDEDAAAKMGLRNCCG